MSFLRNSEWPTGAIFRVITTIAKTVNISNPFICRARRASCGCWSGSSTHSQGTARLLCQACVPLPGALEVKWPEPRTKSHKVYRLLSLQDMVLVLFAEARLPRLQLFLPPPSPSSRHGSEEALGVRRCSWPQWQTRGGCPGSTVWKAGRRVTGERPPCVCVCVGGRPRVPIHKGRPTDYSLSPTFFLRYHSPITTISN